MGRPATALLLAAAASLAACGEDAPPPSSEGIGGPITTPQPREVATDPLVDGDGVPLASDDRVAGLVLPRGLTEIEELRQERRHVYRSDIRPDRMLRYFGPRLTTMEIEHVGDRVTYQNATPRDARGGVVHLDVTIEPTASEPCRVTILERPPPPPEGVVVTDEALREYFDSLDPQRRE